jgi:hypothetical protein
VGRSTKTNTKRSVVSSLSDDEPLVQRLEQSAPALWDHGFGPLLHEPQQRSRLLAHAGAPGTPCAHGEARHDPADSQGLE